LEEDTAKLSLKASMPCGLQRAGVPLLEIVPSRICTTVEAALAYATRIRAILRYLGVKFRRYGKGVLRFEANVSVRPPGSQELRTRTEIKTSIVSARPHTCLRL